MNVDDLGGNQLGTVVPRLLHHPCSQLLGAEPAGAPDVNCSDSLVGDIRKMLAKLSGSKDVDTVARIPIGHRAGMLSHGSGREPRCDVRLIDHCLQSLGVGCDEQVSAFTQAEHVG